jgi:ankyrin repeat protein
LPIPQGETPLHFACEAGFPQLVKVLLDKGANPNSQTHKSTLSALDSSLAEMGEEIHPVGRQTPLHLALAKTHNSVVKVFLDYKGR